MFGLLKTLLPRSLYGRAALILIVPIVTIQLVVSVAFIQRHFEKVTQQMTEGVGIELRAVLAEMQTAPAGQPMPGIALARALEFRLERPAQEVAQTDAVAFWDLPGRVVIRTLREGLPGLRAADLESDIGAVRLLVDTASGPVVITLDRRRVAASNPHQLLVLMIATSALMTLISYIFLRNQVRPIKKLAEVAEAFGKGRHVVYRPQGALEVRAAGRAFVDMRARIERQIEQRTLMLSGVSHDLRTPLTRLRLGLSMLPEDAETAALLGDVADMERLVDEFLAFARGDAMEETQPVNVAALVQRVVENAQRAGQPVQLRPEVGPGDFLAEARLRPMAIARALENLIGNAVRFGTHVEVSLVLSEQQVRISVEDDGPGIPPELRDEAMAPFTRLDRARDPNRGGGVGLGLSIAADIARSHGGALRLSDSEALGGLKAELRLAR
ncbi:ATP-binding protein [Rhodobacter ferrooxidans]|uniref:histidine kinase n=1 Tax=Rhodobacter ferrooxidans TaxID=371731 RepID=C8S0H1_9RHOB|nr:ATP-binding protein [Rhodobacter sp. SW2]EEW25505.1 histidine kinase [Rhodobacter sp. SW2]